MWLSAYLQMDVGMPWLSRVSSLDKQDHDHCSYIISDRIIFTLAGYTFKKYRLLTV